MERGWYQELRQEAPRAGTFCGNDRGIESRSKTTEQSTAPHEHISAERSFSTTARLSAILCCRSLANFTIRNFSSLQLFSAKTETCLSQHVVPIYSCCVFHPCHLFKTCVKVPHPTKQIDHCVLFGFTSSPCCHAVPKLLAWRNAESDRHYLRKQCFSTTCPLVAGSSVERLD